MYSVRGQQMFEYLSWYYADSRIMQSVLDSQGTEIDNARTALEESLNQFYAQTVDWGIERWEKELAITPPDDATLELRRALVKAKLLATEIMTPERIQAIANCFVPSQAAKVIEILGTYSFKVQTPFDDMVWIQEMRTALNQAKPAHLAMIVEYYAQFFDDYPELKTEYFLSCQLPSMVDGITWRGRRFDGGWHYTAPVVYGGVWNLDGQQRHDGALSGDDDPVIAGSRFDSTWRLDGSKTFVLANPTRKVSFNTEEPEELHTTPTLAQSDTHGVVLLFDGASRKMDGLQTFGAMNGPQDANDVHVDAVLHQADDVETTEAMAMQTACPMRDNYPLPRLQYFSGAWAFGQGVTHDGSRWFNSGEKYDGLPGLPDPAVTPVLLDGKSKFDGANILGAPQPVVTFGADADAADTVAMDVQLTATETVSSTEAVSVTAVGILEDFAYADVRLDGSFRFTQPACFNGFWQQRGAQLYDGVAAERAGTLPEPEPMTGTYNGQSTYNGGADAAYDGRLGFNTYPIIEQVARFNGRAMQDNENISLNMAMQDAVRHAARMDGAAMFDGSWDLDEQTRFYEQEQDEITIGRWFGGGWQFDGGNTLFFGGAWGFDGSYLHNILGTCRDHFDSSLVMDGTTVFWKGGETFEHYRYAAN